jgi:hypothetical protein
MPEIGSATFYRQHAERLTFLAADTTNPATRLELLEIATGFQKLADHASANGNLAAAEEARQSRATRKAAVGQA